MVSSRSFATGSEGSKGRNHSPSAEPNSPQTISRLKLAGSSVAEMDQIEGCGMRLAPV